MPEYKFQILCTKLLDEITIHKAAAQSINIDIVSFIEIEKINSPELIQKIQSLQSKKITVVFTSVNSVESVSKHLTEKPDWKIFSIGGATKEKVLKFFDEKSILATAKNATALSEKIIAHKSIKELTFFCGDQRLNELPETLFNYGINVNEIVVYKNILRPVAIEKDYDAVVFFSPSAVNSFFSLNTLPINTVIFSIGKTTTATIQSYCSNMVITSEWPGKEQMIERIIGYFNSNKISA
ncbi:MAG TPA: uroporphyrinogen-III synthase [Chitinophagaceae bacterium]|nr:uroporphyrinogen-III synthase [Chitinophagaceae bacterium]